MTRENSKKKIKKKNPLVQVQVMKSPSVKDLHSRVEKIEKTHGKALDIGEELRTLSTEYSDIRSRIESTDMMLDYLMHKVDSEKKMIRYLGALLGIVFVLTVIITIAVMVGM